MKYTIIEVANHFGVSRQAVFNRVKSGEIKHKIEQYRGKTTYIITQSLNSIKFKSKKQIKTAKQDISTNRVGDSVDINSVNVIQNGVLEKIANYFQRTAEAQERSNELLEELVNKVDDLKVSIASDKRGKQKAMKELNSISEQLIEIENTQRNSEKNVKKKSNEKPSGDNKKEGDLDPKHIRDCLIKKKNSGTSYRKMAEDIGVSKSVLGKFVQGGNLRENTLAKIVCYLDK